LSGFLSTSIKKQLIWTNKSNICTGYENHIETKPLFMWELALAAWQWQPADISRAV
jgi:hypothetical protein